MRESTKLTAVFVSLQSTMASEGEAVAKKVSGIEAISIITYLNQENKYWFQRPARMPQPVPNMGPWSPPGSIDFMEDVITRGEWPKAVGAFIVGAVEHSSLLTLYVESGLFGLSTVFSVRYFNPLKKNPCLIKFNRHNLSEKQYERMLEVLYSKKNVRKHTLFGLKKRESLEQYEY